MSVRQSVTNKTPANTAFAVASSIITRPALKERLGYSLRLMKPITWFAPMWAFLCGAVAVGMDWGNGFNLFRLGLGIVLAGPILCGLSQVLNDWVRPRGRRPERTRPAHSIRQG